jgi:pentatricopeptide repeat protein
MSNHFDTNNPRSIVKYSKNLRETGHPEKAVPTLEEAIRKWPQNAHLVTQLITIHRNNPTEALRLYKRYKQNGGQPSQPLLNSLAIAFKSNAHLIQCFWEEMEASESGPDPEIYFSLIIAYSKDGHLDKAEWLFQEVKAKRIRPHEKVYGCLINIHGKNGNLKKATQLFEEMKAEGPKPNEIVYSCLINAHGKSGDLKRAEILFKEMKILGLSPNIATYSSLIDAHGKNGSINRAESLFQEMMVKGLKPNEITYNTIINAYGIAGCFDKVELLFEEMKSIGTTPSEITYRNLINIYGTHGNLDRVDQIYQEMQDAGFHPCTISYNTMINIYGATGNLAKAEQFFEQMRNAGLNPDEITYSTLIDIYGKHGNLNKAEDLFREMQEIGLKANEITYSSLIDAHGKNGSINRAESLFQEMMVNGPKPNEITYNTIINAQSIAGCHDKVIHFFEEMKVKRLQPSIITCNILINTYRKIGRLDKAEQLFQEMKYQGLKLDETSYNTLIDAYGKIGDIEKIIQLFEEMQADGLKPDLITYSILIDFYGKHETLNKAEQLFQEMKSMGLVPNETTYNSLIDAYSKEGNLDKARQLFEEMQDAEIRPGKITYSILIDAYGKYGDIRKANHLFEEMKVLGLKPDMATYSSMINIYGTTGDVDKAEQLFQEMKITGIGFDNTVYSTLINIYGMNSNLDKAEQLFEEMQQTGLTPNKVTYSSMINAYGTAGKLDNAESLFHKMKKEGLRPEEITYSGMINAYGKTGNIDKIMELFKELKNEGIIPNEVTYSCLMFSCSKAFHPMLAWDIYQWEANNGTLSVHAVQGPIIACFRRYIENVAASPEKIYDFLNNIYDEEFYYILGKALNGISDIPNAILNVAWKYLDSDDTANGVCDKMATILSRAAVRAYYRGSAGGYTFSDIVSKTLSIIFAKGLLAVKRLFLWFIIGEKNFSRKEIISIYSEEAYRIFGPILDGTVNATQGAFNETSIIDRINNFLRQRLPDTAMPKEYYGYDSIDFDSEIRSFIEDQQSDYTVTEDYETTLHYSNTKDKFNVPSIFLSKLLLLLKYMVSANNSPFRILKDLAPRDEVVISRTAHIIYVTFLFYDIDSMHTPARYFENIYNDLSDILSSFGYNNDFEIVPDSSDSNCLITVKLKLKRGKNRSMPHPDIIALFDYLEKEQRRYLQEFTANPDFFSHASNLIDISRDDIWQINSFDWIEYLRHYLDRKNAILVHWLLFDQVYGRHLQGPVHDLKKHVQSISTSLKNGHKVIEEDIQQLRKNIFHIYSNINKMFIRAIYEDNQTPYVHLINVVQPIIQKIHTSYRVNISVSGELDCYLPIDSFLLNSAIFNLLHNAAEAVSSISCRSDILFHVSRDYITNLTSISIVNSYDPDAKQSQTSTGIGINESKHIIETLCHGSFSVEPSPQQRIWTVRIALPGQQYGE